MQPLIRRRSLGNVELLPANLHPILRRLYASRGAGPDQIACDLKSLLPPSALRGLPTACALLADALRAGSKIVIAGDYDADGATGTAVGILGLRALGATAVGYVVPDRFRMGYGLSPALAEMAAAAGAQLLVTVDNGISSVAGVARAKALGMRVIVTDHHLAGAELPAADAIVNPNQLACEFASKHLAGVGVMFYLLVALRAHLRESGWFANRTEPNLSELLDLVALGTVADVVRLDYNNRVLVAQGLARIRAGRARPGIYALLEVAGRSPARLSASDMGFVLGPRINAAGRLEDIRTGIECLLAPTPEAALPLARQLDQFNRDRRELEAQMRDEALTIVAGSGALGVCIFQPHWHEGVVGLIASRVKDHLHRPAFAFARAQELGLLKGSGRSIAGFHLRDALAAIDARRPGLIHRFGGHAMAAGLTIAETNLPAFAETFEAICGDLLDDSLLERVVETDGELEPAQFAIDTALALESGGPWGQGFPEPLFEGAFQVQDVRVVGESHAKYRLAVPSGPMLEAIHFGGAATMHASGQPLRATFQLTVNRYRDLQSAELRIQALFEP
jgi:single-stranded-DNA-specific exonuclease